MVFSLERIVKNLCLGAFCSLAIGLGGCQTSATTRPLEKEAVSEASTDIYDLQGDDLISEDLLTSDQKDDLKCLNGRVYYADHDGDGYGQYSLFELVCHGEKIPENYVLDKGEFDCDDQNGKINPPAKEVCDSIDNNCNGQKDEGAIIYSWKDNDGDGEGNKAENAQGCTIPENYVTNPYDCNDKDKNINALAKEKCDFIDNNCNGETDESFEIGKSCSLGVGTCESNGQTVCTSDGLSTYCNALSGNPNPETCDGIDNDCDGVIDNGAGSEQICGESEAGTCTFGTETSQCLNGILVKDNNCTAVFPTFEIKDGLDNDCDGQADEDSFENLIFSSLYGFSNWEIMGYNLNNGSLTNLSNDASMMDYNPHVGGKWAYFVKGNNTDKDDVYRIDIYGENLENMTNDPNHWEGVEAVSSTGHYAAVVTNQPVCLGGEWCLYILDSETKELKKIDENNNGVYVAFSPDEKNLAFAQPYYPSLPLYVYNLETQEKKQIAAGSTKIIWLKNDWVLYVSGQDFYAAKSDGSFSKKIGAIGGDNPHLDFNPLKNTFIYSCGALMAIPFEAITPDELVLLPSYSIPTPGFSPKYPASNASLEMIAFSDKKKMYILDLNSNVITSVSQGNTNANTDPGWVVE